MPKAREVYRIDLTPLNAPTLSEAKANKYILPEIPCDKCRYTEDYCQSHYIACRDFRNYIECGTIKTDNRFPKRKYYRQINPKEKIPMPEELKTTLNEEQELTQKLEIKSLKIIDLYFDNKEDIDKAKIACLTYGLLLKRKQLLLNQLELK